MWSFATEFSMLYLYYCVPARGIIDTLLSDASVSSCVKHMHRQRLANEKSMPPLSFPPPAPTLSIRNPISPPSDFFASLAFFAASSAFRFSSSSFFVGTYYVLRYWVCTDWCFKFNLNVFSLDIILTIWLLLTASAATSLVPHDTSFKLYIEKITRSRYIDGIVT